MSICAPNRPSCLSRGPKPAGWRLESEVLCTLPSGAPADVRTLADDFRLPIWEMRKVLEKLRERYGIAFSAGSVVVPMKVRKAVDTECASYWRRVYESGLN